MYEKITDWQKDLIDKGSVKNYRRKADGQIVQALRFDPVWVHRTKLPEGISGLASANADNWAYDGCIFWIGGDHNTRIKTGEWLLNGQTVIREDTFLNEYEKE